MDFKVMGINIVFEYHVVAAFWIVDTSNIYTKVMNAVEFNQVSTGI